MYHRGVAFGVLADGIAGLSEARSSNRYAVYLIRYVARRAPVGKCRVRRRYFRPSHLWLLRAATIRAAISVGVGTSVSNMIAVLDVGAVDRDTSACILRVRPTHDANCGHPTYPSSPRMAVIICSAAHHRVVNFRSSTHVFHPSATATTRCDGFTSVRRKRVR